MRSVAWFMTRACVQAGVPPVGAHRLRHTAAIGMLREGASLPEIAQVLRHREIKTTAIYALGAAAPKLEAGLWPQSSRGSWPAESATPVSTAITSAASGLSATPTRYGFASRVGRWTGAAT
jgi:Phage integrase family